MARAQRQRRLANVAALVAGAVAAVFVLPSVAPWSPWLARGEGLPVGLSFIALVVIVAGAGAFVAGGPRSAEPTGSQ